MSHVMRKQTLCICKNKDADQLGGNHKADLRLQFSPQNNSSTCYIQNFKPLAIFRACTACFVPDLVPNHIVGFLLKWLKFLSREDMVEYVNNCDFSYTLPSKVILIDN